MKTKITFNCDCCGEETEIVQTNEAAISEAADLFPGMDINNKEEAGHVCEDCFIKIMEFNEPQLDRYLKYIDKELNSIKQD